MDPSHVLIEISKMLGDLGPALIGKGALGAKIVAAGAVYVASPLVVYGLYDVGTKTRVLLDDPDAFVEKFTLTSAAFWTLVSPMLIPPDLGGALPFPLSLTLARAGIVLTVSLYLHHLIGTLATTPNKWQAIRKTSRWAVYLRNQAAWPPKVAARLAFSFAVKTLRTLVELIMGIILYIFRAIGLESVWVTLIKPLLDMFRKFMDTVSGGLNSMIGGINSVKGAVDGVASAVSSMAAGAAGAAKDFGDDVVDFFGSDMRLKNRLTRVGEYKPGVGIYEWEWTQEALSLGMDPFRTRGVLAQEVLKVDPEAVRVGPRGFLMIANDYFVEDEFE